MGDSARVHRGVLDPLTPARLPTGSKVTGGAPANALVGRAWGLGTLRLLDGSQVTRKHKSMLEIPNPHMKMSRWASNSTNPTDPRDNPTDPLRFRFQVLWTDFKVAES